MTWPANLDPAIVAVLDDDYIIPVVFAEMAFDSGTVYAHDDLGLITWGGNDWTGVGDYGGISSIRQDDTGKPQEFRLFLSMLDTDHLDESLNQNPFERECIIYVGFRDAVSGALVADPVERERGYMDVMPIIDSPDGAVIELVVESEMIGNERSAKLYYSDNQLQSEFSGDLGLQYLAAIVGVKTVWARNQPVVNFSGGTSQPVTAYPGIPGSFGPP